MVTFVKQMLLTQVFMLVLMMGFSQTYISTANSNNRIANGTTVWTDPVYIVQDDVGVESDGVLQIDPTSNDITILVEPGNKFTIEGTIVAIGNPTYQVTFTEYSTGYGWAGINIENNANANSFVYCTFEYVLKTATPCGTTNAYLGAVYLNSSSNTSFSYCTFSNNSVACSGGGLAANSSKVSLAYCMFSLNGAGDKGGGAYIVSASQGSSIANCSFSQNTATYGGGAFLTNCSNQITVSGNEFNLNEATNGAGICFNNITASGFILFSGNDLDQNIASNNGGGLYVKSSDIEYMEDNFFRQNEADNGAGAYFDESVVESFGLNSFESNEAVNNGGAMVLDESFLEVRLNKISVNHAGNDGGGLYIDGSHSGGSPNVVINCEISGGTAENNGGGIFTNADFYSYSNTITDNDAPYGNGGGLYHDNCTSTITNTIIWGNDASNYDEAFPDPDETNGGYSYCCTSPVTYPAAPTTCTTSNPDFIGSGNYMIARTSSCRDVGDDNAAQESYDLVGGNRVTNSDIDIGAYEHPYLYYCGNIPDQTEWTNHNPNGIDYIVDCDVTVPSLYTLTINAGTEIAFDDGVSLTVNGELTANGNANNYITFTASDQSAGWAGIDITDNSNTNDFDYCIFEYVKKPYDPSAPSSHDHDPIDNGAIFLSNSNNTTFEYCIFRYDTVYHSGGGLFFYNSKAIVSHCDFYNNEALMRKGGGIFIKFEGSDNHSISSSTFTHNKANSAGEAIAVNDAGTIDITDCDFYYNEISTSQGMSSDKIGGGAIAIVASPITGSTYYVDATVSYCDFFYNKAYYDVATPDGGAVLASEQAGCTYTFNLEISNSTFKLNHSDGNGGTICLKNLDNTIKIFSNIINENDADGSGGGIYMWSVNNNTFIHNNLIAENTSSSTGGGIFMDESEPNVYNCTITENTASNGGDGVFALSLGQYTSFINDIIWPDTFLIDYYYYPDDINSPFKNCDLYKWNSFNYNDGNLNADPRFVNCGGFDYLPRNTTPISPCIEAGQTITGGFTQPTYDLRGNNYRTVSQIDMGAFEHPGDQSYKIADPESSITTEISDEIFVYPNPLENYFNLVVNSEDEGNVEINLINSLGKTVYSSEYLLHEGDNFLQLERQEWPSGIYFLEINLTSFESKVYKILFE